MLDCNFCLSTIDLSLVATIDLSTIDLSPPTPRSIASSKFSVLANESPSPAARCGYGSGGDDLLLLARPICSDGCLRRLLQLPWHSSVDPLEPPGGCFVRSSPAAVRSTDPHGYGQI
ncbi:hypothetical protein Q3G72_005470 [Acer saccharum]|nr:hypothetical protein Q3G72_005470 [Acer saccharum]